ncbi:MAG: aromatic ring-hydroxylating dioxygenase subunit alpha [Rhodospirillales bacterium]|nr:aromatic ring-hydroxylating dioxygenase subunit alpha [Rhodospirillales bacterium]
MNEKDCHMHISTQELEKIQAPVAQAQHAPGFIYTSPEVFELDKSEIFMKDWLCVGREEEVENPGDFMAIRILDEPVVLVRGRDGNVRAFANICAHRGVEVAFGTGNVNVLSCPFHGWTYGLDGKLVGAPHMKGAEVFETKKCGLPPIRLETWRGWLFINFDDDAIPLEEFVAPLEKDFGYIPQEEYKLAVKTVGEVECNWKLLVENLIDFYHVNVVHKTTNGRAFTMDSFEFEPRAGGGYLAFYNSGPSTPTGEPIFGRAPWMEDKANDFSTTGLLGPNFTFFARTDTVHPYITWPISPTRSRLMVYTLVPKMFFDQPEFEERAEGYRDTQKRVLEEDRQMLESVQNGLASRNFKPGRMSPVEKGVNHIISNYMDRLKKASDGSLFNMAQD